MGDDHSHRTEPDILVSELPATTRQNWAATALVTVTLVVFGLLAPFSATPVGQLNAFFPSLDAIVLVTDLVTAVLLFTQFTIARSPSLVALASGYFFTALIVIPHALTFAGAFSATGLLGANNQTGSWLFIFWHFGFGAALLAYALFRRSEGSGTRLAGSSHAIVSYSVAGAVLLVLGLTWLSTAGTGWLPEIITPQSTLSPTVRYFIWGTIAVTAAAIGVLAVIRRSLLDLWLLVVGIVFIMELVFSGLLPSVRFSLGFYAGRILSLITSAIVLVLLLVETMRLYAELARSNKMLMLERENKLMTMDAIAASISHELKQPLGSVILNCETAKIFVQNAQPDVQQTVEILDDTIAAAKQANEHLEGVRDLFSRYGQAQNIIDINEIAKGTVRLLGAEMKPHNIVVRTDLSSYPLVAYGHRGQIQQVLVNLLSNAVDALTEVTNGDRAITMRTAGPNDGMAVIEVEDSGPGLPSADDVEVFEPFVTTKSHGMGLGLAICRTIVDRHGGNLTTEPAHPRGTIFRVRLPVAQRDTAQSSTARLAMEQSSVGGYIATTAPG